MKITVSDSEFDFLPPVSILFEYNRHDGAVISLDRADAADLRDKITTYLEGDA